LRLCFLAGAFGYVVFEIARKHCFMRAVKSAVIQQFLRLFDAQLVEQGQGIEVQRFELLRVNGAEQFDCIVVPRPPEVVREIAQGRQAVREGGFYENALEFGAVLRQVANHAVELSHVVEIDGLGG
jgi:hypothetical protein